jgi:hypothetical protein
MGQDIQGVLALIHSDYGYQLPDALDVACFPVEVHDVAHPHLAVSVKQL